MNTSTEHILQCNQLELPADASGRIVDLMNENGNYSTETSPESVYICILLNLYT